MVGVSWYEATAFAAWLTALIAQVRDGVGTVSLTACKWVEPLVKADVNIVRLPTEEEWERLAGGVADKQRFAWDPPQGPATQDKDVILARANISDAEISGTSPVAMYPLGISQPYKLAEMTGNIWRWTNSWYIKEAAVGGRVIRGGSWFDSNDLARCVFRNRHRPVTSSYFIGCWVVAPIGSDF